MNSSQTHSTFYMKEKKCSRAWNSPRVQHSGGIWKKGRKKKKKPCLSKHVKRELCSLSMEGRKTLFVAAVEEKKKSPARKLPTDGKYIFNSSVILCGLVHICPAVLGSRNS